MLNPYLDLSALHEAVEYHEQTKLKSFYQRHLKNEDDYDEKQDFRLLRSEIAARIQATIDPELILREGSVDLRHLHTFTGKRFNWFIPQILYP